MQCRAFVMHEIMMKQQLHHVTANKKTEKSIKCMAYR